MVARAPAPVQTKLLAAFLTIVALLVVLGADGLRELSGVNERTEELIKLQRKIEAYRQVQHDTTSQLYSVASALLSSDDLHDLNDPDLKYVSITKDQLVRAQAGISSCGACNPDADSPFDWLLRDIAPKRDMSIT